MNEDQSIVKLNEKSKEYYEKTIINQVYWLLTKIVEYNIWFIGRIHYNGVIKKIFIQLQSEEDQEEIESLDSNNERSLYEIVQAITTGKVIAASDTLVDEKYCGGFWILTNDNNTSVYENRHINILKTKNTFFKEKKENKVKRDKRRRNKNLNKKKRKYWYFS